MAGGGERAGSMARAWRAHSAARAIARQHGVEINSAPRHPLALAHIAAKEKKNKAWREMKSD